MQTSALHSHIPILFKITARHYLYLDPRGAIYNLQLDRIWKLTSTGTVKVYVYKSNLGDG